MRQQFSAATADLDDTGIRRYQQSVVVREQFSIPPAGPSRIQLGAVIEVPNLAQMVVAALREEGVESSGSNCRNTLWPAVGWCGRGSGGFVALAVADPGVVVGCNPGCAYCRRRTSHDSSCKRAGPRAVITGRALPFAARWCKCSAPHPATTVVPGLEASPK